MSLRTKNGSERAGAVDSRVDSLRLSSQHMSGAWRLGSQDSQGIEQAITVAVVMGKCKEPPPDEPRPTFTPEEKMEMLHEIARRHGYRMVVDANGQQCDNSAPLTSEGANGSDGFPSAILNDAEVRGDRSVTTGTETTADAVAEGGSQYHDGTPPTRCPTCRLTLKNCRCMSQEQWEKQLRDAQPKRIKFRTAEERSAERRHG